MGESREEDMDDNASVSVIKDAEIATDIGTSVNQAYISNNSTTDAIVTSAEPMCSTDTVVTRNTHPIATELPLPTSILQRRQRGTHSPLSSPHKLGEDGPKHRRTVTVQ